MKKIINKLLSLFLAVTMCFTVTPVFAASIGSISSDISVGEDTVQNAQTRYSEVGEGTANTDVYLTIDDNNIVVGVPTEIIVSGTPDENGVNFGEYSVSAVGDIAGNKELTITPNSSTVTLTQTGKNDVTATITQEKTVFTSGELANGTTSNGRITANLTAGSWKGNTTFTVSLGEQLLNGYTALYEYDLSATENDDVKAYYMVPNANTKPIETETVDSITAGASLLSTITSLFQPLTVYAAESNVIEKDGIKYEITDEDTLVIEGIGNMKSNVYQELGGYKTIQELTYSNFKSQYPNASGYSGYRWTWASDSSYKINKIEKLSLSGRLVVYTPISDEKLLEVQQYADSLASIYCLSVPKTIIIKNGVTNIPNYAFYNGVTVENITIPNSVTSIGSSAFEGCTSLTNITIPSSVTSIGSSAFEGCTSLTNITIRSSVTSIGSSAFAGCTSLTNITIPSSVTSIGSSAFEGCTSLTNITIPSSVTSIGSSAFQGCDSLTSITIPDSVTSIESSAFLGCDSLTNITIPDSVISIGTHAFSFCTSLTSITIPDSVTSIGNSTFHHCTSLTNINIPDGVTSIEKSVFRDCDSLTNITIPSSVTSIGSGAFESCDSLTSITIPDGVTSIGSGAFAGCTSLTRITIPDSVISIGTHAFYNLASSSTIYCETQAVADLLTDDNYKNINTTVVVSPEKFS